MTAIENSMSVRAGNITRAGGDQDLSQTLRIGASEIQKLRDRVTLAESSENDYWEALTDIELLARELYSLRGEDEEVSRICNLIFKRSPTSL